MTRDLFSREGQAIQVEDLEGYRALGHCIEKKGCMKAKKDKDWFENTRFTDRIRYDPKWKEYIQKEKGPSLAAKLDKILEEKYGTRKPS